MVVDQGVTTFVRPIELSLTGIKIESKNFKILFRVKSSDQGVFEIANQAA